MSASPTESRDLLKVGQLAVLCGRSVRTIRFYEELGLLAPTARSTGGFRLYTQEALLRIKWIDRLQELGFSLNDIQDFLHALENRPSGPDTMADLRSFYEAKLTETQVALERMRLLETDLRASIDYLQGCGTCAPTTPRTCCSHCQEPAHQGQSAPDLVAALTS